MTRARTLKSIIRARMSKTGERYTAARRHVVATSASAASADRSTPVPARTAKADPRGAVSDARIRERTGHDLAHWFGVLDRFGAAAKGHTAAARHLHDHHGVPGWHAQGITVAYERARGLRAVNQRPDGSFDFSVTKVVAAGIGDVAAALTEPRRRSAWTRGVDRALVAALAGGLAVRGLTTKANGERRCRYRWGTESVEVLLRPQADGRTSVVVVHGALASAGRVEVCRPLWRATLTALAARYAEAPPRRARSAAAPR